MQREQAVRKAKVGQVEAGGVPRRRNPALVVHIRPESYFQGHVDSIVMRLNGPAAQYPSDTITKLQVMPLEEAVCKAEVEQAEAGGVLQS